MIRTFILAAVALLPLSIPAAGTEVHKDYNAETMLNFCTGQDREADPETQSFICTFRMQGVIALMVENCISRDNGFQPMFLLSASPPPSKGAARQAFRNYMEANHDKWGGAVASSCRRRDFRDVRLQALANFVKDVVSYYQIKGIVGSLQLLGVVAQL